MKKKDAFLWAENSELGNVPELQSFLYFLLQCKIKTVLLIYLPVYIPLKQRTLSSVIKVPIAAN